MYNGYPSLHYLDLQLIPDRISFIIYLSNSSLFLDSLFSSIHLISFFGCIGSPLLRAFPSCGEQGPFLVAVRGLLIAMASLVAEHGL